MNNNTQTQGTARRETLIQSLQHRLEVARAKGDEKLIAQLEAEAKYLRLN